MVGFHALLEVNQLSSVVNPNISRRFSCFDAYLCQAYSTPNMVQIQALSHRLMELATGLPKFLPAFWQEFILLFKTDICK
jgi:hypothetical protein